MFDKIEKLGESTIQHGPNNNRLYLMKLADEDRPGIVEKIERLTDNNGYTKIFAKVPEQHLPMFLKADYNEEARIPGLKKGKEKVYFMSKYLDHKRGVVSDEHLSKLRKKLSIANSKGRSTVKGELPDGYLMRLLTTDDGQALAKLYDAVFDMYPFPIFDPAYLRMTMQEHILYFGVFHHGKLVAAASSEMDFEDLNAEMTDFATRKDHLGKNLSYLLLKKMEKQMQSYDMKTLYTISRSESIGMNTTFARRGYQYAGLLRNNTMIGSDIECMNVWYKSV